MEIKKSYQLFGFPIDWGVKKSLDVAKAAGFDAVEVNLREEIGDITLGTKKSQLMEIYNYAESIGMRISGIATETLWAYPLTSNIKEKSDKADIIVEKMIEVATYLKAENILIIPGLVHTDLKSVISPEIKISNERMSYEEVYERAIEKISKYGEWCKGKGVTIAIENIFWNKFLLSPFDIINFIDKINSENVKIYLDVGNVLLCGLPEHWIKMFGKKRIQALHLKDLDTSISNFNGFKSLLAGDVDWEEVYRSLIKIDYNGYVTYEGFTYYKYYPEEQAFSASRAIDKIFKLK